MATEDTDLVEPQSCPGGACGAVVHCGTGTWSGPKPGDPPMGTGDISLTANATMGGIRLNWNYPSVNSNAVAHTKVYRASSGSFEGAVELAVVAGNQYFDSIQDVHTYYYWIRLLSINGTEGDLIGPASATTRSYSQDIIEQISGQIQDSDLAQSLRQEIGRIDINYQHHLDEIDRRLAANAAWQAALAQVQSGLVDAVTVINTESYQRIEGQNALVGEVSILGAANANAQAAIIQERQARITADTAQAELYTALNSQVNNPTTGLPATRATLSTNYYTKADTNQAISTATQTLVSQANFNTTLQNYATTAAITNNYYTRADTDYAIAYHIQTLVARNELETRLAGYPTNAMVQTREFAKIGYSALVSNESPYDGNGVIDIYPAHLYPAADYPQYVNNRKIIIDAQGVVNWNATPAGQTKPVKWVNGMPLGQAIKKLEVIGPNGDVVQMEGGFQAQANLNGQLKSQHYIKINNFGLVSGYGLYNDGATASMGFDVDSFWVGRTAGDKVLPFMIDTNGVVYINKARIGEAAIDTWRIEQKSVTVPKVFMGASGDKSPNVEHTLAIGELNIPTKSSGVLLIGNVSLSDYGTGGTDYKWKLRFRRNGDILWTSSLSYGTHDANYGTHTAIFIDENPPAGTYNYIFTMYCENYSDTHRAIARDPVLIAMGAYR